MPLVEQPVGDLVVHAMTLFLYSVFVLLKLACYRGLSICYVCMDWSVHFCAALTEDYINWQTLIILINYTN